MTNKTINPLPLKTRLEKDSAGIVFRLDVYDSCVLVNWHQSGVVPEQYCSFSKLSSAIDFMVTNFGYIYG